MSVRRARHPVTLVHGRRRVVQSCVVAAEARTCDGRTSDGEIVSWNTSSMSHIAPSKAPVSLPRDTHFSHVHILVSLCVKRTADEHIERRQRNTAIAERPRELGDFKKARVNGGSDNHSLKGFSQVSPLPLTDPHHMVIK